MGTYLNPGSQRFLEAVNSEIYVDKTEMILYLNSVVCTKQKYVSVSRPRRFGKSMAADMICAYYGEGRDLFSGLKLGGHDGWEKYCNQYDVIRIVMTDFFEKGVEVSNALAKMQKMVIRDIKKNIRMWIILIRMILSSPCQMSMLRKADNL